MAVVLEYEETTGEPMAMDRAIELTDALLYERTGRHLSDLQYCILQQSWGGKTYGAIATVAGYSEGHVKDVAAQLWRLLSEALGERITKGNYRSRLKYWLQRAKHKVVNTIAAGAGAEGRVSREREDGAFVGRREDLAALTDLAQQHRLIVIQGEGGLGKTTLAQMFLQGYGPGLTLMMAKETASLVPAERVVEEWLRQDFNEEPGLDFGITLDRLRRHLRQRPVGILIDNFEPALDVRGQLVAPHRQYVELLRVLADPTVQSITLVTSRDRICEPAVKAYHYRLPGLSVAAWEQFFALGQVTATGATLRSLHGVYGGNAKAMEILGGTAQTEYDSDLDAYWQVNQSDPLVETDLTNLIHSQIERIQALDPAAYTLLRRLSCYRYQAISRLPAAALLAQMDNAAAQRAIASLRNRSLLEAHRGEYWLHPAVRAVMIAQLRHSNDWASANLTAARFWTSSIEHIKTATDALQALEAYYHYFEIQDYQAAAGVLLKSRHNQWQQFLPLASSLYRMGLLQPVTGAIAPLLSHLEDSDTSELHNILGDVFWIRGDIQRAIACQQRTIQTTQQLAATVQPERKRVYYLRMLNIDSHLSIGLYHIDLWELAEAKQQFEQVVALAAETPHRAWAEKATVALSLVQAQLGETQVAKQLADQLQRVLLGSAAPAHSGRFAYFIQLLGQTYACLGEQKTAASLYRQAIAFADASHYLQIKGRALTGLGELARRQHRFEQAIAYHTEALDLLDRVGARCDLAEAHLQSALTLARSSKNSAERANRHFQTSMQLFDAIHAPCQVQKAQRLWQQRSQF